MTRESPQTDRRDVRSELQRLVQAVETQPVEVQAALAGSLGQLARSVDRRDRLLMLSRATVEQLRLDVRYLLFDRDATRRERDALKLRLDET